MVAGKDVKFEFFFDVSSPWTYLAFHNIQPLCADLGVDIIWRPFLVGGVFNTINPSVYNNRENPVPAKAAYSRKDLQDWARLSGITINWPSIFPINSVRAMRACFYADEQGVLVPFATKCFEAYWGRDEDINDTKVLAHISHDVGLDPGTVQAIITTSPYKDRLRDTTQELMDRGGFGSPTMFINDTDMYFGNDRLPLVHAALKKLVG